MSPLMAGTVPVFCSSWWQFPFFFLSFFFFLGDDYFSLLLFSFFFLTAIDSSRHWSVVTTNQGNDSGPPPPNFVFLLFCFFFASRHLRSRSSSFRNVAKTKSGRGRTNARKWGKGWWNQGRGGGGKSHQPSRRGIRMISTSVTDATYHLYLIFFLKLLLLFWFFKSFFHSIRSHHTFLWQHGRSWSDWFPFSFSMVEKKGQSSSSSSSSIP